MSNSDEVNSHKVNAYYQDFIPFHFWQQVFASN